MFSFLSFFKTNALARKHVWVFWLYWVLAHASFLTTINLPYQGEEAVYTITSMEMVLNGDWINPTLYGANYGRPPLYNWLMIPLAQYLGWGEVLVAARWVTALATMGTSLVLMTLVKRISKDRYLAFLSAGVYLSADVLWRRGWLAYSDPLFAFFSFSALACAWIALEEQKIRWMIPAVLSLMASFLCKAFTGYVFYALGLAILLWRHPHRSFLWQPPVWLLHLSAVLFVAVWHWKISQGSQGSTMLRDIGNKWAWNGLGSYLLGLLSYPLETCIRWLPVSILLLFLARLKKIIWHPWFLSVVAIIAINYLPYWLSPHKHIRYLMPLYPLMAWALAHALQTIKLPNKTILGAFSVILLLRYGLGFFWFPFYEKHHRSNYQAIAEDMLTVTQGQLLYSDDATAAILSVSACVDSMLMVQHKNVKYPTSDFNTLNGFLMSYEQKTPLQVRKTYALGRKTLYLLCGGSACQE